MRIFEYPALSVLRAEQHIPRLVMDDKRNIASINDLSFFNNTNAQRRLLDFITSRLKACEAVDIDLGYIGKVDRTELVTLKNGVYHSNSSINARRNNSMLMVARFLDRGEFPDSSSEGYLAQRVYNYGGSKIEFTSEILVDKKGHLFIRLNPFEEELAPTSSPWDVGKNGSDTSGGLLEMPVSEFYPEKGGVTFKELNCDKLKAEYDLAHLATRLTGRELNGNYTCLRVSTKSSNLKILTEGHYYKLNIAFENYSPSDEADSDVLELFHTLIKSNVTLDIFREQESSFTKLFTLRPNGRNGLVIRVDELSVLNYDNQFIQIISHFLENGFEITLAYNEGMDLYSREAQEAALIKALQSSIDNLRIKQMQVTGNADDVTRNGGLHLQVNS